jgi:hypothetical protein
MRLVAARHERDAEPTRWTSRTCPASVHVVAGESAGQVRRNAKGSLRRNNVDDGDTAQRDA